MDDVDGALTWRQSGFAGKVYELHRGETLVGTLRFQNAFGSRATAEIEGARWTFKRMGFLRTRVTIRPADSQDDLAIFRNNTWTGGGTLEFPDGAAYRANTNFWHTQFEFVDQRDCPLVRYHMEQGLTKLNGGMEVLPAAAQLPERPWVMMLGWYLAVMMHSDDASAATVAAASV